MHTILAAVRYVFGRVTPADLDRDAMIGDLEEEHAERLRMDGRPFADRWLLGQLLRSIWPLLRARSTARAFRRSAIVVVIAWFVWAGVFAMLTAASVWLFRTIPAPPGLRILAYLGVTFLAAVMSGQIVQRSQMGGGPGGPAVLAGLLVLSITAIFHASPEHEAPVVWLVWTTAVAGGVFTGARNLNRQFWRSAS